MQSVSPPHTPSLCQTSITFSRIFLSKCYGLTNLAGRACFILKDIYRLASHKKDLAQILSCLALGNMRPDNQYWSGMILQPPASHKSQEGGGDCLPGPHHFCARKVTGIRRGPPVPGVSRFVIWQKGTSGYAFDN